jgi:hypothetical protein
MRRRILIALGAVCVLSVLAVVLLPWILSMDFVRTRIERSVSESSGQEFRMGSLQVRWGATRVGDIVFGAEGDRYSAKIASVEASPEIGSALRGDYRIPRVLITRPEILIDLSAPEKVRADKVKTDAKKKQDGDSSEAPPFQATVEVVDGSIVIIAADGSKHEGGKFSFVATAGRDTQATFKGTFLPPGGGSVALDATSTPFADGRAISPKDLVADSTVRLVAVNIEALGPLLRAFLPLRETAGLVEGTAALRLAPDQGVSATTDLSITGLRLTGPLLGEGRTIDEPAITLKGTFLRGTDGSIEARDSTFKARGIEATGTIRMDTTGASAGSATLVASLGPMAERARAFGLPVGGAILGDVRADIRALGDGETQRWSGTCTVLDLQVSPGPGRAPVLEPKSTMQFDIIQKGRHFTFDGTRIDSSFLRVELGGHANAIKNGDADLSAKGVARLGPVMAIARALGTAPPGDVTGDAEFDTALRLTGGTGTLTGSLVVHNLEMTSTVEGATPVREPNVKASFDIAVSDAGTEIRSISCTAGFANLSGSGMLSADTQDGTFRWDGAVNMAPALTMARGFGVKVPAELAGAVRGKGTAIWTARGKTVDMKATIEADDLVATLPTEEGATAREFREPRLTLDVDLGRDAAGTLNLRTSTLKASGMEADVTGTVTSEGVLALASKGNVTLATAMRLASVQKTADTPTAAAPMGALTWDLSASGAAKTPSVIVRSFRLTGTDVDLDASGTWAHEGGVSLKGSLAGKIPEMQRLIDELMSAEPGPSIQGTAALRFEASAADANSPVNLTATVELKDLSAADKSGGPPWTQKAVSLDARMLLDRAKSSGTGTVALRLDDGTATLEGGVTSVDGKRAVDIKGAVDLDLAGIVKARPGLAPEGVVPGRLAGTLALRGPVATPLRIQDLGGEAKFTLDAVDSEYFRATAIVLDLLLQQGTVATRTMTAAVNGGTVSGRAAIALDGVTRKHLVEVDASGVAMDNDLAGLLSSVVPFFIVKDGGRVTGRADVRVRLEGEGADWKAVKRDLVGEGTLKVVDGTVSSSGIIGAVVQVLGGASELAFQTLETAFSVRDRRVWNDRLSVDGKEHNMILKGSTHFNGTLDYAISAKVLGMGPKKRAKFAAILDADGNLPFRLGGTLDRPEVKPPDLKNVLGGAFDELKRGLGGLLGGDD